MLHAGIEKESLRTPYEILVDELPGKYHAKLAVVSGPSFAKEIGIGLPTSVTCAAHDSEAGRFGRVLKTLQGFLSTYKAIYGISWIFCHWIFCFCEVLVHPCRYYFCSRWQSRFKWP